MIWQQANYNDNYYCQMKKKCDWTNDYNVENIKSYDRNQIFSNESKSGIKKSIAVDIPLNQN